MSSQKTEAVNISPNDLVITPLKSNLKKERLKNAKIFLAPMLIVLFAVAGWPLIKSIWFGFTDASLDGLDEAKFIGFKNYLEYVDYGEGDGEWVGLLVDAAWWKAVWNTVYFSIFSVSFELIFGLMIAYVLNMKFKFRGLIRASILIPWAIPTIVSAKMWAWMLNDQFGIINDMLMYIGVIDNPVAWTASSDTAMMAVLMVDIWKTTPFMVLLLLAGMQTISNDIYEAAKIDGVHPVKVYFKITLPLLMPTLTVAVIFRMLDSLRIFDLIYILANNEQTKTMSIIVQENLFQFDKFAYGSAAATMLFLIIGLVTILYIKISRVNLSGGK